MELMDKFANIDRIVSSIQDNDSNGFFFIPWIGCNYEEGLRGKKVLVVGASHYCVHSNLCKNPNNNNECSNFNSDKTCLLGCSNFQKCTVEHSASECDDLCSYMKTECHSELYTRLCKDIEINLKCHQIRNRLKSTTLDEVCSFLDPCCYDNYSFSKFTNFNKRYFDCEKEVLWKNIAFVNYAQNFQQYSTGNSFVDSDYEAFKLYVELLNPDVVIVWGDVGNELYNCKFKKNAKFHGYIWENKDVIYIHTYHPSYSGYEHGGNLKSAMNRVFKTSNK